MKRSYDCVGQYLLPFDNRLQRLVEAARAKLMTILGVSGYETTSVNQFVITIAAPTMQTAEYLGPNVMPLRNSTRFRYVDRSVWNYHDEFGIDAMTVIVVYYYDGPTRKLCIYDNPADLYAPETVEPPLRRSGRRVQGRVGGTVVNGVLCPRLDDAREENRQVGVQHARPRRTPLDIPRTQAPF